MSEYYSNIVIDRAKRKRICNICGGLILKYEICIVKKWPSGMNSYHILCIKKVVKDAEEYSDKMFGVLLTK